MVEQRRGPAIVARGDRSLALLQHGRGAAHRGDILLRSVHRRQRIEIRRVAVVPAEVHLVHGLGVVAHGAVVAAVGEAIAQRRGQLELLGDLARRQALVREAQRLVVDVTVRVALRLQVVQRAGVAPHGPVMAREHHFHAGEAAGRIVDVAAPLHGVAHLRAAQRVEVVQRVRDDLGAAPRLVIRQVEGELRGRLRLRRVLEDELHAVEFDVLRRAVDDDRRLADADRALARRGLAQPGVHVPGRRTREGEAVHESGPPSHRHARQHVLAGGFFHEAARRHDGNLRGRRGIRGQHALDPAEVIDVTVGEDDRRHGPVAEVLARQRDRGGGRLPDGERVDDDPARLALDQRHVGDVVAAHLVDAGHDLEQAVLPVQFRLAPEARVHALRARRLR